MSREARFFCVCLMATIITVATGCSHKPAYSELDANRGSVNRNQSPSNASQATTPSPSSQPSSTEPAAPSPESSAAPPTTAPPKRPSFFDEAKGSVRDLPDYPGAQRVSVQIGPLQGINTMSLGLRTKDSMDKITAFYEQVIKANKWTVVDKLIDPELSEWSLKKGEDNSAKVQVKKDLKTSTMTIVIVRGEKLEESAK
jgi:hypothetical protein